MGCGRERQAAAPPRPDGPPPPPPPGRPPVPAAPPGSPPPVAAPVPAVPAGPSPVGVFLGRTVRGDWRTALKIAAWPTLMPFVLACVLGIFSSHDTDGAGLGWGVRMRCALAVLLQSVGGRITLSGSATGPLGRFGEGLTGEMSLSLVPLVITGLWVLLLALAARRARRAAAVGAVGGAPGSLPAAIPGTAVSGAAVAETVLRIAVLCGAGTFALGLLAQPSYDGMELSSSPWLALLCSFALAALVSGVVLARDGAQEWLAVRPGWRVTLAALRTALIALLTVVLAAGAVAYVSLLASADHVEAAQAIGLLVLLPNLGAIALAMAWGAPVNVEWNLPDLPFLESGRKSLGYGELGHFGGGWTLFGVIVGGLVGALLVGVMITRRSADRRERLLAAGFFVLALVLVVWAAGATAAASFHDASGGGYGGGYGDGGYGDGGYGDGGSWDGGDSGGGYGSRLDAHGELTAGGAETLLFALLWTFGAVLLAPYLLMMAGRGSGPVAVDAAMPVAPAAPVAVVEEAPTPAADVTAAPTPEEPRPARRRVVKWVAAALIAFLIGGGATAGALYYRSHHGGTEDHKTDRKPAVEKSAAPTPSASPTVSPSPSQSAPSADLPAGFERQDDPYGFSLGVTRGWQRTAKGTQVEYRPKAGDSVLRIVVRANAPRASYDTFLRTEKDGGKKPLNYQRVKLEKNTFRDGEGALWEFTYVNDQGATMHAVEQAYVAADGTEYTLSYECIDALYAPDDDKVFSTALNTWQVSATDVD